jgi:hypothetical protein
LQIISRKNPKKTFHRTGATRTAPTTVIAHWLEPMVDAAAVAAISDIGLGIV